MTLEARDVRKEKVDLFLYRLYGLFGLEKEAEAFFERKGNLVTGLNEYVLRDVLTTLDSVFSLRQGLPPHPILEEVLELFKEGLVSFAVLFSSTKALFVPKEFEGEVVISGLPLTFESFCLRTRKLLNDTNLYDEILSPFDEDSNEKDEKVTSALKELRDFVEVLHFFVKQLKEEKTALNDTLNGLLREIASEVKSAFPEYDACVYEALLRSVLFCALLVVLNDRTLETALKIESVSESARKRLFDKIVAKISDEAPSLLESSKNSVESSKERLRRARRRNKSNYRLEAFSYAFNEIEKEVFERVQFCFKEALKSLVHEVAEEVKRSVYRDFGVKPIARL